MGTKQESLQSLQTVKTSLKLKKFGTDTIKAKSAEMQIFTCRIGKRFVRVERLFDGNSGKDTPMHYDDLLCFKQQGYSHSWIIFTKHELATSTQKPNRHMACWIILFAIFRGIALQLARRWPLRQCSQISKLNINLQLKDYIQIGSLV